MYNNGPTTLTDNGTPPFVPPRTAPSSLPPHLRPLYERTLANSSTPPPADSNGTHSPLSNGYHPSGLALSYEEQALASLSSAATLNTHNNTLGGSSVASTSTAPPPASADTTGGRKKAAPKKRKSSAAPNGPGEGDDGEEDEEARKKRIKTPRACDNCRRKKIRCDAIEGSEPPHCVHCKSHGLECTWFLPIAETRFKRQRAKDDEPPPQLAALSHPIASTGGASAFQAPRAPLRQTSLQHPSAPSPPFFQGVHGPNSNSPAYHSNVSSPDYSNSSGHARKEPRILGPTSIGHLMHSTSTFPVERLAGMDAKYSQVLTVNETGDGFIRVMTQGDHDDGYGGPPSAVQGIDRGDAESLLNYFFATHSAHFPVVSKADFLSYENPPPLLFNTLCGIAAFSHHVSPTILRTIKGTVRALMRDDDILDNSSINTIQALLMYSFSMELEKTTAGSKTWNSLGLAIRMAQDLGLHRKLSNDKAPENSLDNTELRRRVWGGCLIADRWVSAMFGQPLAIDLADCDCLLPSVFEIRPNQPVNESERPFLFNNNFLTLTMILGRILKLVYSPSGIMTLSSEDANQLIADLDMWRDSIPEELKFTGPNSTPSSAGYLHLLYIPVRFLITRPFMRISFQLPERFAGISLGRSEWDNMVRESRETIEWVDKNEHVLEGFVVGLYSFFIASLIQYHSHIREREASSLETLRLARDVLKRLVVPETECYARGKISEIVHLLYHTACSVKNWAKETTDSNQPSPSAVSTVPALNPTAGVRQRAQDWHPPRQAAYSTSLRSTHVPAEPEEPSPAFSFESVVEPTPTDPPAPFDTLNFNPTLNGDMTGFDVFDGTPNLWDWQQWDSFFTNTGAMPVDGAALPAFR